MEMLTNQPFGLAAFLQHLNVISLSVIFILLFMSVLSWYLTLTKAIQLGFTYWRSNRLLKLFWNEKSLAHLSQKKDPFSNLAQQGINASLYYKQQAKKPSTTLGTHSDFITRNLRRAINEETARLDSGLTILATVGSTAPFIGLFGTVLGIYDALITISARGSAALDSVAAPVGEALIMTAFGLAVAIPAVLGYNALVRGNRAFFNKMEGFAHDLYTYLNTGERINMKLSLQLNPTVDAERRGRHSHAERGNENILN
jgi:biopolymer transport protein ExbB